MRRVVVAVIVLAVALAVARAGPAGAQNRQPTGLALASQTPWVKGDDPFTLRLDVESVRRPQRLDLVVVVHRAVTSRSQFTRTLSGALLGAAVHRYEIPFANLRFDAGGAIPVSITVPGLRPGVYPVSVDLVDHENHRAVASLVTHLIRVPDEPIKVPLSVAWVQPYGVAPALRSDGTTKLSESQLEELRTIASKLDRGIPMTVTPTPETIAALSTIDDGRTLTALSRLLRDHQVVATPFVDADASALVGAGRTADLGRQRGEGDRVLRALLDITGDYRTWSLNGAVTPGAISALDALGVSRVIVDEPELPPLPSSITGGLTLARPFRLRGGETIEIDAVSVDHALTAHFRERDDVLAAHHLLADLAVLQLDAPGIERGTVIRPPRGWHATDALLSTALDGIAGAPFLKAVALDDLFTSVEPLSARRKPVVRDTFAAAPPFGFAPSQIDAARQRMDRFASIGGLSNPELRLMDRLLLVAESSALRPPARRAYVDAVFARVSTATFNVRVLGARTYRLTAREGTIPLTFVNDNPFEVRVNVELTSDKLTFRSSTIAGRQDLGGIVLGPNGTTTEAIPVKARTSGAFPLRVVVRSPDGQLELGRTTFTITSTVASGVGIFLSVGALGFLMLWWGSHWRTVRRARRLVSSGE